MAAPIVNKIFQVLIEKKDLTRIHCWAKLSFKSKGKIRLWDRASLVAQWSVIRLPKQGSAYQSWGCRFETWSGRIPHDVEQLSPWATTAEPALWRPRATTTEARVPGACAPQQKPPQWEARAPQWGVAPAHCNLRKPVRSNEDPTQSKINK